MRRIKEATVALAVGAIIAAAIPALASAAVGLEQNGKPLPIGAKVSMFSTNARIDASKVGFETTCQGWTGNFEVTANGTREIIEKGKPTHSIPYFNMVGIGEGTSSGCGRYQGEGGRPVTKIKYSTITPTSENTGTVFSTTFTVNLPELRCNYELSNSPFSFVAGTSSLTFNRSPATVTPAACGPSTFSGTFALFITTNRSAAVIIN